MSNQMDRHFLRIASILFVAQWTHLHNHWTCKGGSYYGDHLLFMRIYEGIAEEIDTLVEKWVAMGNPAPMSSIIGYAVKWQVQFELVQGLPERSLAVEKAVLKVIGQAFDEMEKAGHLSLGLNDFLAAVCNKHETAIYLLQQRQKQASKTKKVKELPRNKVTTIPPSDPLSQFFQNPAFAETRQFSMSGADSNTTPGHSSKAPPTVNDILIDDPGSESLSTLSRLQVPK